MKYRRFRVFDIILVVLTLLFSVVITSGDIKINYRSDDGPFDPMASPTATTEEATGVAGYNATLQGTLTSDGGESCITGFEYGLDTSYGTNVTALPTYVYAGGATTLKIFKYWVSNMTKNAETVSYGGIIYALAEDDTYIYAGGATSLMAKQYYKSNMTLRASTLSYGGTIYALAEDSTYIYAGGATNQSTKQYYKSNMTLKANTISYGGDIRAIVEDSEYIYVAGVLTNRVRQYWKSNMTYKAQTVALLPGAALYGLAEDENYIYVGGETNLVSQFWKSNMTLKANTSTSYGDIVRVIAIDDTYIYVGGATQMTVKQYWKTNMSYKAQTPSYGWTTNSIAVDSTYLYVGETTGNTVRQYYKYNLALKANTTSYGGTTYAISSLTDKYATGNAFSFNSTGLTPLTTYHYRAYAINSAGKSVGDDKTFTTTLATPIVTTNSATGLTSTNATLQGTLTQDGGEPCNVSFEYGITTSYGTNSTIQTNKLKDATFSFDATGLIPLQLYHYRTYANNSLGGVTGEDKTFTALNPPVVYVDDDAAPGWYDVAHVHTIQQGVTNASDGGTIYVYGGTYPETLVSSSYITIASKNLTIIGDQADMPKIRPLMSNSSTQNIFLFSGSGYTLTLQYLNISNYWGGNTTASNNGISVPAQNNLIVDHCVLHDVYQIMTCYGNTTLTNSTAYNFKYYVFYGTWSGATYALKLICKYNTFYDSVFTVWSSSSAIIKPKYGHWYGDISYNYLAGGRIGIWIDPEPGLVCKFGGNWTISHNTIDSRYNPANVDNISQGISFTSVTGNFDKIDLRDNIINGANHYSIYHGGFITGEPVATNTIVKNCLFNNSYWLNWNISQQKYQWNGTGYSTSVNYPMSDVHTIAGWTNSSVSDYMFNFLNCNVADPMFNLTGAPGQEYWGLRYGSPAVGTASDGTNIGCWQGTPTGGGTPNQPPLFSNETPSNGSAGQSISFNWNITIQDPDSTTFNWTIQCSNGDSNSLNDDTNGSKELTISGLSYSTIYTVWVNATDGTDWTREWFTFTTMDNTPPSFGTPTPTNGSTDQEISLTWQIPINDSNGDLLDWSIECSNSDGNSSNGDSNGSKELDISGLSYSTEYTVWVNATDGTDWTRKWFTFTTRGGTMSIFINQTSWNANCLSGENVSTGPNWALLQNTGDLAVDVSIEGTNTTAWLLEASPDHNKFQMQWGVPDDVNWTNILTSPAFFIGNLAYGASQPFGLKLFMPTSSSTTAAQTSTLTFIATPS